MLDEIERLVDLVSASGVYSVTVEGPGRSLTIELGGKVRRTPVSKAPRSREAGDHSGEIPVEEESADTFWITAPMVGIFHQSDPPMVSGMPVRAGQTVGAIESMKLMNDIRSDESGVILEAVIENGHSVEYGHPLFLVAPDATDIVGVTPEEEV